MLGDHGNAVAGALWKKKKLNLHPGPGPITRRQWRFLDYLLQTIGEERDGGKKLPLSVISLRLEPTEQVLLFITCASIVTSALVLL